MVIKLRSIINKIISIGVCVLLSFSIYKKCSQESQAPHTIVIQADSLLSDQALHGLTQFVHTTIHPLESVLFSEALTCRFPCIASYEVENNAAGGTACLFQTAQPILSINNAWVLTHDNHVASVSDFSCAATQSLRNVTMPKAPVTDTFAWAIQKLSPDLFQTHTVVWLDDQEALLCDRANNQFAIRFNADSLPTSSIMRHCELLKNDLQARGVFAHTTSKKKQNWIADIRFKNQIILSRNVEGVGYG